MKLYAIVNGSWVPDVTTVRRTFEECMTLLESKGFDRNTACHLDIWEYDDGNDEGGIAEAIGCRPLEVAVCSHTKSKMVWGASYGVLIKPDDMKQKDSNANTARELTKDQKSEIRSHPTSDLRPLTSGKNL